MRFCSRAASAAFLVACGAPATQQHAPERDDSPRPGAVARPPSGPVVASGGDEPGFQPALTRAVPCDSLPYCRVDWAACARVALRAAPDDAGAIAAVVDSSTTVTVIAGELQTRPGVAVVRQGFTFQERYATTDGEITPADGRQWRFVQGDTIEILGRESDGDSYVNYVWTSPRGGGTTAPFWGGLTESREHDTDAVVPIDSGAVTLLVPLRQRWWARVRTADGRTGWTRPGRDWAGESYDDEPIASCRGDRPGA